MCKCPEEEENKSSKLSTKNCLQLTERPKSFNKSEPEPEFLHKF